MPSNAPQTNTKLESNKPVARSLDRQRHESVPFYTRLILGFQYAAGNIF